MKNSMNEIEFNEKVEGKKAVTGIVTCLMYCFGVTFLQRSVSGIFGILTFVTWILPFVLYGKAVLLGLKKQSPAKIIIWTLLATILCFVFSTILFENIIQPMAIQILGFKDFSSSNTSTFISNIQNGGIGYALFLILGGSILGPLVEELLYRVSFFRIIRKKNRVLAHLATAFLFGVQHVFVAIIYEGHPQEILLIGGYMAFSLVLTIMYEKTKTPVPGMFAHMILNGVGLALTIN